jgi:hypothetical protein
MLFVDIAATGLVSGNYYNGSAENKSEAIKTKKDKRY